MAFDPTLRERVESALEVAVEHGSVDGERQKQWVIDRMVRALLGSDLEYRKWLAAYDVEGEAEWDRGIAP